MRHVSLRGLLGVVVMVGLVLAACSSPREPASAPPGNPIIELDGYQAQIDVAKLDLSALSLYSDTTEYCSESDAGEVQFATIPVPMLGRNYAGKWVLYYDVFFMPKNWNHKLALYAHGYLDPTDPDWLDSFLKQAGADGAPPAPGTQPDPMLVTRDKLLCQHYALGLSSYAAPGYAVQEGIADTHLLNAVFRFLFWTRPAETYVFGSSMGGLITVALAEAFPWRYDGAMPTCGPIGGSMPELAYVGNVRLLFEQADAYGSLVHDPPQPPLDWPPFPEPPPLDPSWDAVLATALATDARDPTGLQLLANTAVRYTEGSSWLPLLQTPQNYASQLPEGLATSLSGLEDLFSANALLHALRYYVVGAGDIIARGRGGIPWTNMGMAYAGIRAGDFIAAGIDSQLPAGYQDAVTYYGRYYQPTGELRVPMLSLHTPVDPDVPAYHELAYRTDVQEALGKNRARRMLRSYLVNGEVPADLSAMAVQQGISLPPIERIPYGHCNFAPDDLVTALQALDSRATERRWPDLDPSVFMPLPAGP